MRRIWPLVLCAASLMANPVFGWPSLVWDASIGASVAGYYVYSGRAHSSYTSKIDVGIQTSFPIPSTTYGQTSFFAVTAYDVWGSESTFSNEVIVAPPASPLTAVVEYRNDALDHYFITIDPQEISDLDAGVHKGWARTGLSFNAFGAPALWTNPVCRFYIPPQHGDSHFFSASADECALVLRKATTDPNYSGFVYEAAAAFYIGLPEAASGACPEGAVNVYRLWKNRADSNHRYTTSQSIKSQMVANGYILEGYGPDSVNMCSPP